MDVIQEIVLLVLIIMIYVKNVYLIISLINLNVLQKSLIVQILVQTKDVLTVKLDLLFHMININNNIANKMVVEIIVYVMVLIHVLLVKLDLNSSK